MSTLARSGNNVSAIYLEYFLSYLLGHNFVNQLFLVLRYDTTIKKAFLNKFWCYIRCVYPWILCRPANGGQAPLHTLCKTNFLKTLPIPPNTNYPEEGNYDLMLHGVLSCKSLMKTWPLHRCRLSLSTADFNENIGYPFWRCLLLKIEDTRCNY